MKLKTEQMNTKKQKKLKNQSIEIKILEKYPQCIKEKQRNKKKCKEEVRRHGDSMGKTYI